MNASSSAVFPLWYRNVRFYRGQLTAMIIDTRVDHVR